MKNTDNVTIATDHTLYAHWKAKTVTVSFDANGGSVSTSSKTVTINQKYGSLPTPSRSSYDFNGWYTSRSGGSHITSNTTVTTITNHTLYAHWTLRPTPTPTPTSTPTPTPTSSGGGSTGGGSTTTQCPDCKGTGSIACGTFVVEGTSSNGLCTCGSNSVGTARLVCNKCGYATDYSNNGTCGSCHKTYSVTGGGTHTKTCGRCHGKGTI